MFYLPKGLLVSLERSVSLVCGNAFLTKIPWCITSQSLLVCAMYGQRQFKDVNVLRYMLIKERCGLHDGSINLNKYI